MDWERATTHADRIAFVRRLIALRREQPVLRQTRYLTGEFFEDLGAKDVTWLSAAGAELTSDDWSNSRAFGMLLTGPVGTSHMGEEPIVEAVLILFNASHEAVPFVLPAPRANGSWETWVDSSEPGDGASSRRYQGGEPCQVASRSLVVLGSRDVNRVPF
jgi:isoamylase